MEVRNKKEEPRRASAAELVSTVDPLPYAGITQVRFQGLSDRSDSQPCGAPSSGNRWYRPPFHEVNGIIGLGPHDPEGSKAEQVFCAGGFIDWSRNRIVQ